MLAIWITDEYVEDASSYKGAALCRRGVPCGFLKTSRLFSFLHRQHLVNGLQCNIISLLFSGPAAAKRHQAVERVSSVQKL